MRKPSSDTGDHRLETQGQSGSQLLVSNGRLCSSRIFFKKGGFINKLPTFKEQEVSHTNPNFFALGKWRGPASPGSPLHSCLAEQPSPLDRAGQPAASTGPHPVTLGHPGAHPAQGGRQPPVADGVTCFLASPSPAVWLLVHKIR